MYSPCTLNRLIQTRCHSGQARGELALSRRTRSKLALISWVTQPDSQYNRSARTPLLETRMALGYTWRWRVTTSFEERITSLARVKRVYNEFSSSYIELQWVAPSKKIFLNGLKILDLLATSSGVVPRFAEPRRVVTSYAELHEELLASYRELSRAPHFGNSPQLATTRHHNSAKWEPSLLQLDITRAKLVVYSLYSCQARDALFKTRSKSPPSG